MRKRDMINKKREKLSEKKGILRSLIILASALLFIFSFVFLVSSLTDDEKASLQAELDSLTAELNSQGYSWLTDYSISYPSVEVYRQDDDVLITKFENINEENWYKVYLTNLGECYDNETEILTENGWKYFYELTGEEKVMTLNSETGEKEWQLPMERQEFEHDGEMYKIELEGAVEDGKESELLVSEKHKVYVNRGENNYNNPNSFDKSSVENISIFDCCLNASSSDQIGVLFNANDKAKYGSSSVPSRCGDILLASERNLEYLDFSNVLTDFFNNENKKSNSDSSISENLIILSFFSDNSFNVKSGEISSHSAFNNSSITYLLTDFDLKNENKIDASTINDLGSIFDYNPCFLATSLFTLFASSETCSSVNLLLDNISSAIENSTLLMNCLVTLSKAISNLSLSSSGTSTLIQTSAMEEFNEEVYLNLSNFKLQPITEAYSSLQEGKELYFLDKDNKLIKVKSITKQPYKGKIYDVDVENDIVLVRRKNSTAVWSGNSDSSDVFDLKVLGAGEAGGVEFDYIVDPGITECPTTLDTANTVYTLSNNLVGTGGDTCLQVNANNITIDFQGYSISELGDYDGVAVSLYNSVTIKNGLIEGGSSGISSNGASNNIIQNMTLTESPTRYCDCGEYNEEECASEECYWIGGGGLFLWSTSNYKIIDTRFIDCGMSLAGTGSINNTFLNVSYNLPDESVASGSQLIRKWYYRAYVNDSNTGANVSNANVTAYNVSNSYNFNLTTDSTGYTPIGEIIDYINNGTRTYYSPYTIYAGNSSYPTISHTYNASLGNNLKDVFTFTAAAADSTAPNVTINFPVNGTTYNTNSINFNITAVDNIGMSSCWYSLNSGVNNITMTNSSANIYNHTNSSMSQGSQTAKFYCNDTSNIVNNSMQVIFTIDTIAPAISIVYPANNTNSSNNMLNVNYTVSGQQACWYSNDTMSANTTLTGCANITGVTWAEGQHNVTIWANDSAGNLNSSSVKFTIDITAPAISIAYPTSGLNLSTNTSIPLNFSASDTGVGLGTCWWTINNGATNNSLSGIELITNGNFTGNANGWTLGSEWTYSSNNVYWVDDGAEDSDRILSQNISIVSGRMYNVRFSVTNSYFHPGVNYIDVFLGENFVTKIESDGDYSFNIIASSSNEQIQFRGAGGNDGGYAYIDNVSVKEVGCANTTINVPEGNVNLILYANDSLNNRGSGSVNFTTDLTAPTISISYPANTTYNINVSALNYTSNGVNCWYSLNLGVANSTPATCGTNWTGLTSIEGSNTWRVYANDSVGNLNSSSITFVKDTTSPTLTITSPLTTQTSSTTLFNVSSNEAVSWCGLSLDGATNQTMTLNSSSTGAGYINSSMLDGSHTAVFSCNDTNGNRNSTSTTFTSDLPTITMCRSLNQTNTVYTLSQSLTSNVNCITIGADNITFNMNGYSITGALSPPYCNGCPEYNDNEDDCRDYCCDECWIVDTDYPDYGIYSSGRNNITIQNGNLSYFVNNIYFSGTNNSLITNMTSSFAQATGAGTGIYLYQSSNNNLTDITANSNSLYGIYLSSSSNNTLTNINTSSNSQYGIYLYQSSNNNTLTNIIVNSNIYGIYSLFSSNNILTNITANSNGLGISLDGSNNILTSIIANSNTNYGIYLFGSGNTLTNIIANSNTDYGIYLGSGNTLTNIIANSNTNYGISLLGSDNTLTNIIANSNINYGIQLRGPNNVIRDANFSGSGTYDIRLYDARPPITVNITCVNCSYNITKENVPAGNQLIRKWYYRAYVNDTNGLNVSGANITAYNVSSSYQFNLTTDSTGYTGIGEIIDYVNNGTRTYYSLYNIYASNSSYPTISHTFNASLGNNLKDVFSLDNVAPVISFGTGTATDYANLSQNWIYVNTSWTETNFANITFSLYNSTSTINQTTYTTQTYLINFTNLADNNYTYEVNITDTANNKNSTGVRHIRLDATKPLISYSTDTLNDSSRVWQTNIYVNTSVTEANFKNITFRLYYSNNTIINTTTYTTAVYNINWTNLLGDDYKYNISVYDTSGNLNSTATRTITLITSQSNITLNSGWNLIALDMKNTDINTDRNISLVSGWNLIGYSSDVNLSLADVKFTNSSGSQFTWAQALANGKVQAYLAYYDSSSALASGRKYKYLSTISGMDASAFENKRGYWVYANQSGNLTLPGVGGTTAGTTYAYSKLRFSNGSLELNISQAGFGLGGYSWIEDTFQHWDEEEQYGFIPQSSGNLNSWAGYFVYSNKDNLTLIRQN